MREERERGVNLINGVFKLKFNIKLLINEIICNYFKLCSEFKKNSCVCGNDEKNEKSNF